MSGPKQPGAKLGKRLLGIVALSAAAAQEALAQAGGPSGSGPIVGAVRWVQESALGPVATGVAVIAVAVVGFMMLTGRMNWKHGITVIVGCFVLFGATAIVAGIQTAAQQAR
jgi:type IV secretion system protein VirB2